MTEQQIPASKEDWQESHLDFCKACENLNPVNAKLCCQHCWSEFSQDTPPTDADRIAALTADVERLTRERDASRRCHAEAEQACARLGADNQRLTDALAAIGAKLSNAKPMLDKLEGKREWLSAPVIHAGDTLIFDTEGCAEAAKWFVKKAPALLTLIGEIQALAGVRDDG